MKRIIYNGKSLTFGGLSISSPQENNKMAGSGTELDPYIITNLDQLQMMNDDMNAYYKLGNDINASASHVWTNGFEPIGKQTPSESQFNGYLDGQNFIINNLYINRPTTNDVGLFGYTDRNYSQPKSYVKNLGLTNIDFTGGYRTGGLIGRSTSEINNCFVTGKVTGDAGNSVVAGFIGQSLEPISNCYVIVDINSNFEGAGFVSFNNELTTNCYSVGEITGTTKSGFCIDSIGHGDGEVNGCFWDTDVSNILTSDGGTGKTTSEMKTESTFTDISWDFSTIWDISGLINSGYPFLQTVN